MREEFTFYTEGKRDCVACIDVTIYDTSIVALAEADSITERKLIDALRRYFFPKHAFRASDIGGYGFVRVDAQRWSGDGAWEVADSLKEVADEL